MKKKLISLASAVLISLSSSLAMPTVKQNLPITTYSLALPVLENDVVITSENVTETKFVYSASYFFSLLNLDADPATKEGFIIRGQNDETHVVLDTDHDGKPDISAQLNDFGWSYSQMENKLSVIEHYNGWTSEDSEILPHGNEKFSYTIPKFKMSLDKVVYTSNDFHAEFKIFGGKAFLAYVTNMLQRPKAVHAQFGDRVLLFYDTNDDLIVDFIATSLDRGKTFVGFSDFKHMNATIFDVYADLITAANEYEESSKPRNDYR